MQHQDNEVKVDACWALSFLADGKTKQIQVVVESSVIPRLIPLLEQSDKIAVSPHHTTPPVSPVSCVCVYTV